MTAILRQGYGCQSKTVSSPRPRTVPGNMNDSAICLKKGRILELNITHISVMHYYIKNMIRVSEFKYPHLKERIRKIVRPVLANQYAIVQKFFNCTLNSRRRTQVILPQKI